MKRIMIFALATSLFVQGCSDKPSDSDIKQAIQNKLPQHSCFTSVLFNNFPIQLDDSSFGSGIAPGNANNLQPFVDAGILTHDGRDYALTDAGKAVYVPENKALCFSEGYEVVSIASITRDTTATPPASISDVWRVDAVIKQKPMADWAKSDTLKKIAITSKQALSEVPFTRTVLIGKVKDKDEFVIDPYFNVSSNASISKAW